MQDDSGQVRWITYHGRKIPIRTMKHTGERIKGTLIGAGIGTGLGTAMAHIPYGMSKTLLPRVLLKAETFKKV